MFLAKILPIFRSTRLCLQLVAQSAVKMMMTRTIIIIIIIIIMGEERGVYSVLLGKPKGRRPLGRPRGSWVDNIRMDLQEVGCGYMDWIGLVQDRDRWQTLVSAVMNLRVP